MKTPLVSKIFTFCAAHQYGRQEWSPEQNREVFGVDSKNHGHNYTLEVRVTGEVNPETGWLVDLDHLKAVVNEYVVDVLDHSQIENIPWFAGKQPSSENLVVFIWEQVEHHLQGARLERIRLHETPTIFTDYYGPGA